MISHPLPLVAQSFVFLLPHLGLFLIGEHLLVRFSEAGLQRSNKHGVVEHHRVEGSHGEGTGGDGGGVLDYCRKEARGFPCG